MTRTVKLTAMLCCFGMGGMAGMGGCSPSTKVSPATSSVTSRSLVIERQREIPPPNNSERGGVLAIPVYSQPIRPDTVSNP